MARKPAVSPVAVAGRRRATLELAQRIEREGCTGIYCPSPGDGLALCEALALVTRAPRHQRRQHLHAPPLRVRATGGCRPRAVGWPLRRRREPRPGPRAPGRPAGHALADVRRFVTDLRGYAAQVGELPPVVLATLRQRMVALAGEIAQGAVWADGARSHMAESLRHLPASARENRGFFIR